MRLVIPKGQGAGPGRWTIYMPDGSKVTNGELDEQNNVLPQRVYDKNGNFVTKGLVTLPDNSVVTGYVDQMGRYVAKKQISQTEDYIYKLGVNGEPVIWKIRWKYITVIRKYTTSGTSSGIGRCCYSDQVMVAQPKVVDEIETPSQTGGLKYKFNYNGHEGQVPYNQNPTNPNSSPGWGDLVDVTLPSGAKAEYDYATTGTIPFIYTDQLLPLLGKVKEKRLKYDTSYDGNVQPVTEIWMYQIGPNGSAITGPDGGVTSQSYYSTNTDNDLSGRVYRETSPSGTIVERIWANNKVGGCPQFGCGSMRRLNTYVKTEFTTVPDYAGNPSLTAIKDSDYDKNGNVIKVTEYDWVPYGILPRDSQGLVSGIPGGATIKRISETSFYNQTEDASNTTANNANSYWNSTAKNVNNAVKSTTVKQPNGTPVSHSEIFYDFPDTKANPIEVKAWDSVKGAFSNPLNAGNSISTTVQYDIYGNPTLTTDAKGNQTQIVYGDIVTPAGTVNGLYPTQTKSAFETAIQRTSTAAYDFNTGLVLSSTDIDNNLTNATEYDAIGRPLKVRTAVGTPLEAWSQTEYKDQLRRVIVRSDLETKGDGKRIAVQDYDQLGRVRLSRSIEDVATEDPNNETHGIKVQTRYQTGNPNSYQLTSNPYRAATSAEAVNEESMGWTRSTSVNTGRHSEVETFSGAAPPAPWGNNTASSGKVQSDIDANTTLFTDQAGKQRRSITNGLGQLIRVDEPDGSGNLGSVSSPALATNYKYNMLGKMTEVTQGVQKRYFLYDSLGRLLRVKQPEQTANSALTMSGSESSNTQWATGFSYDNNGNLLTATNAKNVTITSSYDALNRMLTRSYSDSFTPAVSYTYDEPGVSFSKGELTKVSSSVSETRFTSYDQAGRLKTSEQATDGQVYPSVYTYNLAGILTEQTYPTGRVVKNFLEDDGDISGIVSRVSNGQFKNYASNFNYTASKVIKHLQLGNGLWESAKLNSRNQVTELNMGNSPTDGSLWKLNYDYGEFDQFGNVDTARNSGNIARQTISFNGLAQSFVQNYKYDSLDRISEVKETNGGTQTWKQNWTYDRYSNRTGFSQDVLGQQMQINTSTLPAVDANTNRFQSGQGYQYDFDGNLIQDAEGRQFTFDGDNKQIEIRNSASALIGKYFYDGNGKRVKKLTASETVIFVYDRLGKLVAEYSTATPVQNPTVNYTATDPLGSPRVITNKQGEIVSRRDFMPFGEQLAPDVNYRKADLKYNYADNFRLKFTGYQHDEESGLDFAEARYYNNNHGRFTAVDPLLASGKSTNPQTFNRYPYAMNRPMILTDSTGLQAGTPAQQNERVNADTVRRTNQAAGTFSERELRRFNEARANALRMVAAPAPGAVNPCRDALIANFGNADPTQAIQRLNPQGGIVTTVGEGVDQRVVDGPQNVLNGETSTFTVTDSGGQAIPIQTYFDNNPTVSAAYDPNTGYTYIDDSFNSGRGDIGRAQDIIHESVVHQANGGTDAEFAPDAAQAQRDGESAADRQSRLRSEGSRRINEIISQNCNTIPR